MNNRRTRILILVTSVMAGAFILDAMAVSLWWTPWKKAGEENAAADLELRRANTILAREETQRRDWARIKTLLDKPRSPDVNTHFVTYLGEVCDKVGVNFDIQEGQPQQAGDFREYVYNTKFKLTWVQFVDLLEELHNSREFMKLLRVSINSQYEKEDRLDVDLRISTIEHAPVPAKGGGKSLVLKLTPPSAKAFSTATRSAWSRFE